MVTFADRAEAGKLLAAELKKYRDDAVVYALPRGGVETGAQIAQALDVPMDLLIARKIGHPFDPEYAIGAVTEKGPAVWNEDEHKRMNDTWAAQAEDTERTEAKRRRQRYMGGRKALAATGKTAIIVDDGIATGLTMQAAVREVKKQRPKQIMIATPVADERAVNTLLEEVDSVVMLENPETFLGAIGPYYRSFPQLSDEDVIDILERFEIY